MNATLETTEPKRFLNFRVIGTLVFSLCMVWATAIAAKTWHDVRKQRDTQAMRVTGSATKRIVSDLIESIIKRRADAKDAGQTIPGIGGVFDLSDSLILTAPVGYIAFMLLR